ncbi:MAG: Fimbrial assembly [Rhodocyclaceae bacterium]|nr:Fimbrial assembly [Rhodocyclaceae bacterium]
MIRINLLPHREEARKAKRQQFYALLGMVSVLGALIVFFVYTVIAGYVGSQEEKNEFLKKEIAVLDKQIAEIKRLKEQTQALLARKQVIESLQRDRGETVHVLSELVQQIPAGIYLKSFKQDGQKIQMSGYAQSGARVSALMRNLDSSPWMERPELLEIKAATVDKRRLNEFNLYITVTRARPDENGKGQK